MSVTLVDGAHVTIRNAGPQVVQAPTPSEVVHVGNTPYVVVGGSEAYVLEQTTPASTWSFANPVNRLCSVTIFVGSEEVEAQVDVTFSNVVVTFPYPMTGYCVII